MYEQSHRDYRRSGYLHHRLPVAGKLLIITVITPLPAKPARQKCQRTEAGEHDILYADASAWCYCARCKIPEIR